MAIKAIGFDYLGVTAKLPHTSIFEVIGEIISKTPDQVKESYQHFNHDFQVGSIDNSELWERIAAELGVTDKQAQIEAALARDVPHTDESMLGLVDRVRAAGYRVGLLANLATGTDWDRALYDSGFDRHFDAVLLSGATGFAKPDPRAFWLLAQKLGVEPSELAFTDDRPGSMLGIDQLGVTPILFENQAQLEIKLRDLGVAI